MNNFILISKTFAEVTPESAEIGDYSNQGFLNECEQVTFKELVNLLKIHCQPSQYPNDGNTNVYYSTGFYPDNYATGTDKEEVIHYHKDNTPNTAKYWKLAAKFAGRKISNN